VQRTKSCDSKQIGSAAIENGGREECVKDFQTAIKKPKEDPGKWGTHSDEGEKKRSNGSRCASREAPAK